MICNWFPFAFISPLIDSIRKSEALESVVNSGLLKDYLISAPIYNSLKEGNRRDNAHKTRVKGNKIDKHTVIYIDIYFLICCYNSHFSKFEYILFFIINLFLNWERIYVKFLFVCFWIWFSKFESFFFDLLL